MIKINCDMCGKELEEPGALLFSPPRNEDKDVVVKSHLCVDCWRRVDVSIYRELVDNI